MKIKVFLSSVLFFSAAHGELPDWKKDQEQLKAKACLFDHTLIFGASISAGYESPVSAGISWLNWQQGKVYINKEHSPIASLAQEIRPSALIDSVAEMTNDHAPTYAYGYLQLNELIKKNDPRIKDATLLASLDAFYWPSAHGRCEEAAEWAKYIIEYAQANHKILLLGNVPEEDPNHVEWMVKQRWKPPQRTCIDRVNATLAQYCKSENNCFIVDLYTPIYQLNHNGFSFPGCELNDDKKFCNVEEVRFDGIHLSDLGLIFIKGLVAHALAQADVHCALL